MKKHLYVALFVLVTALMFSLNVYADGFFSGSGSAGGGAPSGDAGGDLDGTYPDPTVVDDSHNHTGTSVGNLDAGTDLTTGTVPTARLGSGTADDSTFLRGDQSWAALTPSGGQANAVFLLGADNGSALADTDDQTDFFCNESGVTLTITEVVCRSDAGTPAVNIQKDDGSPTDMMSSDLTCSTSGASEDTFVSGENVIPDGTCIDFVMETAGGVAKRITFNVTTEGGQGGVGLSPGDDIGEATATTPDPADDTTRVATTEWVNDNAGGGSTIFVVSNSTGLPTGTTATIGKLSGGWGVVPNGALADACKAVYFTRFPVAGTLRNLYCSAAVGSNSISIAVSTPDTCTASASALAVTLSTGTTHASDTSDSVSVNANSITALVFTPASPSYPTPQDWSCSVEFVAN